MKPVNTKRLCRQKRQTGFTMIEMMIVIVMIGILAAMAIPRFQQSIPRLKARAEARHVLGFIRIARSRAIAENTQYGVYFDTNSRRYSLFKDTVNPTLRTYEAGDSVVAGPLTIDRDVVIAGCTFTNNCVMLLPTGEASQTGIFTVNTADGSAPYSVAVLASTGKSKLQ